MSEPIEIHVFGGKIGESVAIGLPGNQWGIVDNYTPTLRQPSSNQTLRFLQDRGVSRLKFICLTHPHADHYRGMSHLLATFKPESVWIFAAMTHRQLREMVVSATRLKAASSHLPSDESETAEELVQILDWIAENYQNVSPHLDVRRLQLLQPLLEVGSQPPIRITTIGAPGGQLVVYEQSLSDCFTSDGQFLAERVPNVNHNLISGGLLIEYGAARIVLGGDVEVLGWQETMQQLGPIGRLRSQLVKVSHHGSDNGYCDGLWENLSPSKSAVAALTQYTSQGLPNAQGLSHVLSHAKETYSSSLRAAALAIDWSNVATETFFSGVSLDAVAALRGLFPEAHSINERLEGACSFKVSEDGTVTTSLSGEAGRFPDNST